MSRLKKHSFRTKDQPKPRAGVSFDPPWQRTYPLKFGELFWVLKIIRLTLAGSLLIAGC